MNDIETPRIEETTELMKGLTYDFAGDIVNLVLPSIKLSVRKIDFFEPIMLGIFLVGYAYYSVASKLTNNNKENQLENYHHEMHNSIVSEICIGVYKIDNIEKINNFSDNFGITLDKRFLEYFPLIDPETTSDYMQLSKEFGKYLFKEKISNHELENFASHLNITIALHLARMGEKLNNL